MNESKLCTVLLCPYLQGFFLFNNKEILEQVFLCKFCEVFKNNFLENTSRRLLLVVQTSQKPTKLDGSSSINLKQLKYRSELLNKYANIVR